MEEKVISIKKYQKNKFKENKMLFIIILCAILVGLFVWNKYVEEQSYLEISIPESNNIFYNDQTPIASTTAEIASIFENSKEKPILLYIYTTWCGVCKKNFANINEIAREFQNTELKVLTIAIDRDLSGEKFMNYLNSNGNIYFEPRYLAFRDGFKEYLRKNKIKYRGVIPYTVLIGSDGKIKTSFKGIKSKKYLKIQIIKELFPEN